ncbi:equilibrative nucleobase transporter 1-like isoform X2 [Lineus longissimus]|uniref:equilibrative nucleobase transporter 1-like isoform X2 n=1 Tax=Lineus longissimus TaxID=88925 RepID=UPI00315CD4C7
MVHLAFTSDVCFIISMRFKMACGNCKRVVGIIFCCVEMLLLSGVMFGWIYLVDVLRNDGVFTDICVNMSSIQNNATIKLTVRDIRLMVEDDVNKQRYRRTLRNNDVQDDGGGNVKYDTGSDVITLFETLSEGQHATALPAPDGSNGISMAVVSPITSEDGWYGILPLKGYRCEEEWQTYVFIYLAAIFGAPFLLLIIGILYDVCGTWLVRIIGIVFIIAGNLMIAYAAEDLSLLLYGGTVLVHSGGLVLLLSNIQLSNYFYSARSTIICVIVGCFFSSSGVYLAIKYIINDFTWVPRQYIFFVMGGITLIPIATTFFFHSMIRTEESEFGLDRYRPRETSHIKMNSKKIYRQTIRNGTLPGDVDEPIIDDGRSTVSNMSGGTNLFIERETYCRVTCTATFILHVMWFSVLQLQNWFIASMRFNLTTETVAYREEIYYYGHICLLILAPVIGVGMDHRRKHTGKKFDDNEIIHLKGSIIPVTVTSILGLILAGIVFIPLFASAKETLYAIDLLLLIVNYFSWATMAVYIFQIYPKAFFGRLFSVTVLIGTIFGACHYPLLILLKLVPEVKPYYVFVGLGVLLVVICSHPVHLTVRVKHLERENEKRVMNSIWSADANSYSAVQQLKKGDTLTTTSDLTLDRTTAF